MKSIWVGIKSGTLLATALRAYAADPDLQQEWMMITVESSSLKSFSFVRHSPVYIDFTLSISAEKLEDILVHLDLHNCVKNLVNIFAPNLKYLKLSGDDIWIGQSLGKSTSLEKAEFFLDSNRHCFKILSEVLNRETTMAVFYGDFVPLLLENVCYLSIHVGSVRDMLLENALLKKGPMPTPFDIDVIIESPSLKSFSFVHHTDSDLFPYLLLSISEKAQLFLKPQADDVKILSEVLRSITINRVEALVLNKETTMIIFFPSMAIRALLNGVFVPGLLKNVCHLSIHIGSFLDILVPEMVSMFGGTCNLRTLEIKSDPQFLGLKTDCSGFNMGYWRLQNLAFIPHLKEVTIELSNGSNGIELAAYMLEYAQNLKKMAIVHSPQQYSVIRKLNNSKRISSATVVFQEDQQRGNKKQRLR
ncbi:unnamed protein product [Prunus armeniaca]